MSRECAFGTALEVSVGGLEYTLGYVLYPNSTAFWPEPASKIHTRLLAYIQSRGDSDGMLLRHHWDQLQDSTISMIQCCQ
jgi:hypothetical protein